MITAEECLNCGYKFIGIRRNKNKKYFCSTKCQRNYSKGENAPNWKGGIIRSCQEGRVMIQTPGHPRANKYGYVYRSILIAEKIIGKYLPIKALVHHTKDIKDDSSIVICENRSYHMLLHTRKRILELGGNPSLDNFCFKCKTIKRKKEFRGHYCKLCDYQYHKEWKEKKLHG